MMEEMCLIVDGERISRIPFNSLKEIIYKAILELCNAECPQCLHLDTLPNDKDIENWLKGEK